MGPLELKTRLLENSAVIGTWNTLGTPLLTEAIARSGLDFVIVDFEHGPFQIAEVKAYVNSCMGTNCFPFIRLPSLSQWMTQQALDQGAQGLIFPHIESKEDAERIVSYAKYSPKGQRGFSPFTKAAGFSGALPNHYCKTANNELLLGIIIESKKGLQCLDAILEVEDIDIVYFGAYDLSQELNVRGQFDSPILTNCIDEGAQKVRAAGKFAGGYVAKSSKDISDYIQRGLNFITYQVDVNIVMEGISSALQGVVR